MDQSVRFTGRKTMNAGWRASEMFMTRACLIYARGQAHDHALHVNFEDGRCTAIPVTRARRRRARLQDLPFQILDELLGRPGEVVTREQLIARLWPKTIVDFDTNLNSGVRRLRAALKDDADAPRYVETLPRKGYRYLGAYPARTAR